jgi:hypothetical protein
MKGVVRLSIKQGDVRCPVPPSGAVHIATGRSSHQPCPPPHVAPRPTHTTHVTPHTPHITRHTPRATRRQSPHNISRTRRATHGDKQRMVRTSAAIKAATVQAIMKGGFHSFQPTCWVCSPRAGWSTLWVIFLSSFQRRVLPPTFFRWSLR